MKKLAVLIAVYNDQTGINKTLESFTKENEVNFDIVVVDDGSKREINLPNNIGGNKVILIRMKENKGLDYALNVGLQYILNNNYKYIARIDAQDTIKTNRFSQQVNLLESDSDLMLVGSHINFIDKKGNIKFEIKYPIFSNQIKKSMHFNSCFSHTAVMLRTEIFKIVGLYSNNYPAAEDYELFFRIVNKYKVHNIDKVLTEAEWNESGISLSKRKLQLSNRFKIQLKYFNLIRIESYLGVIKTLLILFTPNKIVFKLKKIFS
ncbi:glycosyltransferase [Exiguobacterium aurantiacum]|uniref:glycosyltransferase n=1 Tax=Exiguobacterium aurantiacum TaxID=33987 RepID=UPI003851282F